MTGEHEIKKKKYRVEAYIIPINNRTELELNQIDDVKLANKLKDQSFTCSDKSDVQRIIEDSKEPSRVESINNNRETSIHSETENNESISEFSEVIFEINEHIYDEIIIPARKKNIVITSTGKVETEYAKTTIKIEEPIYDEPLVGTLASLNKRNNDNNYDVPQANWILGSSKYRRFGIVAPKLPKRSSSLKSIVEDIESFDDTLPAELCCHGNENGCLPSSRERPEDISEEIFKENWMQRLDALKKLETLLKDKEVALQSRERLLFKKEKELRILERLVKDKMRQAEMYAKRYKNICCSENIPYDQQSTESRSSNHSKDLAKCECLPHLASKTSSKTSLESQNEQLFKNPPNSKSSSTVDKFSYNSVRGSRSRTTEKKKCDDLDSTLSADIGDSSFIITSRKFDPTALKKPTAFMRSASERGRPKLEQNILVPMLTSSTEKKDEQNLPINCWVEEKTFKKISQNILATQDQTTKFLNYGPIDENAETGLPKSTESNELINLKRYSYLNLESTQKAVKSKPRPISWSENTDDWLIKKRQAYNLATKKMLIENTQEKENFDRQTNVNKSTKVSKKRGESSLKMFSIFR